MLLLVPTYLILTTPEKLLLQWTAANAETHKCLGQPSKTQAAVKKRGWKTSKSQRLERSAGKCWMSSGYEMAIAFLTSLPILLPIRDHASKASQHSNGSTVQTRGFQRKSKEEKTWRWEGHMMGRIWRTGSGHSQDTLHTSMKQSKINPLLQLYKGENCVVWSCSFKANYLKE